MTRQLIIGSALVAALAAPALAGTHAAVSATNAVAGATRATNPAAIAVPLSDPARVFKASNPAEVLRLHTPVDFVRYNNPAEMFKGVSFKASDAAALFRVSNPATLSRQANPLAHGAMPLIDDRRLRSICTERACMPFVLRDPLLISHHVSAQARLGLDGRSLILRRMPAPGHIISIELHIGDTTWVNGKIDNQ